MASAAKQFSFFLLLTLFAFGSLHHTHARDSQFFNKIPSTTSKNVVVSNNNNNKESPTTQQPADQDPNFLPENENGYGLYGHESGQLPPSTTTTGEPSTTTTTTTPAATTESKQPLHKYLPKNYNPVAYVTQPELDVTDNSPTLAEENSYTTDPDTINSNNNYYNGEQKYYNGQQETEETEYYRSYPTTTTTTAATNNNNNAGGGSSFNSQPQGMTSGDTGYYRGGSATTFNSRERRSNNNGGGFQPQGLSDTRSLENGKYYYDVSTEKYSTNHPYQNLRGSVRPRNNDQLYGNRNYYENNSENNAGEFNRENTMGGYQNQEDQYQYEEDNNMP